MFKASTDVTGSLRDDFREIKIKEFDIVEGAGNNGSCTLSAFYII